MTLSLPNTTITLAQSYAAGAIESGTTRAPVDLCRVAATIKPGPRSNVRFSDGGREALQEAQRYPNDFRDRSAYPQRSEYVGQGDPNNAANFACVTRADPLDLHNIGVQRAYQ